MDPLRKYPDIFQQFQEVYVSFVVTPECFRLKTGPEE